MPKDKKLHVLEIINRASLPRGRKGRNPSAAYQVDDGTLFYRVRHPPDKLFVKLEEKQIVAELPDDSMLNCGAHGSAIYFETASHKIYKAVFTPPDGITVTCLRNALENEEFLPGALCTRNEDGAVYAYRMSDDPEQDAVYIDTSSDDLYGAVLIGVENNFGIFESRDASLHRPSARRLNDTVILIEVPSTFSPPFCRGAFVYIADVQKLFTLNTDAMEFMPMVQIGDLESIQNIKSIVGVHEGVITVIAEGRTEGDELQLISARLPEGYLSFSSPSRGLLLVYCPSRVPSLHPRRRLQERAERREQWQLCQSIRDAFPGWNGCCTDEMSHNPAPILIGDCKHSCSDMAANPRLYICASPFFTLEQKQILCPATCYGEIKEIYGDCVVYFDIDGTVKRVFEAGSNFVMATEAVVPTRKVVAAWAKNGCKAQFYFTATADQVFNNPALTPDAKFIGTSTTRYFAVTGAFQYAKTFKCWCGN